MQGVRGGLEQTPSGTDVRYVRGLNFRSYQTVTTTWDPPNIAAGATATLPVTVPGARVGDTAMADLAQIIVGGWIVYATVTANDTVVVTVLNQTGVAVDLASGTVRVSVFKHS